MGFFSNSSNRAAKQASLPNPLIGAYTHLSSMDRADEAIKILYQLASFVKPLMQKRNWKVGTLAEFLPDYHALQGLNTNFGQIINIRLRPQRSPNEFHDMDWLMDTMLHELCHNVHTEHDTQFYALLEEVKKDWETISSKGYQGEGFFSQGRTLGKGHVFYKPSLNVSATDRKTVKLAAERRERGNQFLGPGRTLGGEETENGRMPVNVPGGSGQRLGGNEVPPSMPAQPPMVEGFPIEPLPMPPGGGNGYVPPYEWVNPNNGVVMGPYGGNDEYGGRRLGGEGIHDVDPKQLAAIAAEQRALDQKRCGAKQRGSDMRRETERAEREGQRTEGKDIGNVIDLNDLQLYDLDDIPDDIPVVYAPPPGPPPPEPVLSTKPAPGTGFTGNPFQSDWTCRMCTFQNPPLYLACKVCETERDLKDISEPNLIDLTDAEVGITWECRLCTFKNENVSSAACEMCGTEM